MSESPDMLEDMLQMRELEAEKERKRKLLGANSIAF